MALIGAVGFQFIDNAAHAGGLLAGALYAVIAFPKSNSAKPPKVTRVDALVGISSILLLGWATIFTALKLTAG